MKNIAVSIADYSLQSCERLRHSDIDQNGLISNAAFASLLETGRQELLQELEAIACENNCAFTLGSVNVRIYGELTWPGYVDIGTSVVRVGRNSITLDQGVFQGNQCVATARTVVFKITKDSRMPLRLSDSSRRKFSELIPPLVSCSNSRQYC